MSKTIEERLQELEKDTGWVDIELKAEFSNYDTWIPCQVRKVGKLIEIKGAVKGFTSISYTDFATLPERI